MPRLSEKITLFLRRPFWSRGSVLVCIVLLTAYLGVTAWGARIHEPWRDEAQKWLIARDVESLGELWHLLPYEGTPALWPLLLRPLARGGVPYAWMSWLNWGIVATAAALLVFASPLPLHLKAAALSSLWLLHQFSSFASNYSLSLLLLFASLALYRSRAKRPFLLAAAVVLLTNTSVLGALLALALAGTIGAELAHARSRSCRQWAAFGVMTVGFVLLALQIVPGRLGTGSSIENELFNPYVTAKRGVLSIADEAFSPLVGASLVGHRMQGALGLVFLLLVAASLVRRPKALCLLASSSAMLFLLLSNVTSVGFRHTGFLMLAIRAALWLAGIERREAGALPPGGGRSTWLRVVPEAAGFCLATMVFAISCPGAIEKLRFDYGWKYSQAREVADFIRAGGYVDRPIIAFPAGVSSSILPYLPGVSFYYAGLGERGTFVKQGSKLWAGEAALSPDGVLLQQLCSGPAGDVLVLLASQPRLLLDPFCTPLLVPPPSSASGIAENYWLFKCNARAPDGKIFRSSLCR